MNKTNDATIHSSGCDGVTTYCPLTCPLPTTSASAPTQAPAYTPDMHVIRASTLADAHERAIKYILNTGREVVTEDGETTLQSQPMTLVVSNARGPGRLYGKVPFGKKFADEYSSSLLIGHHGKKSQFEYDYHGRLFHWCESANDIDQVDQVEYIIKKLSEQKTSRRAIATTWIPTIDEHTKDVPCLQFIQLWVEPGTTALNMCVAFRSNDFVLALGQNMYALTDLQNHIAERLQLCMGTYTHIAVIPHIYVIRDAGIIGDICEKGKYISPPRAQVCVHCMACDALDVCGTIQTIVRAFTRQ